MQFDQLNLCKLGIQAITLWVLGSGIQGLSGRKMSHFLSCWCWIILSVMVRSQRRDIVSGTITGTSFPERETQMLLYFRKLHCCTHFTWESKTWFESCPLSLPPYQTWLEKRNVSKVLRFLLVILTLSFLKLNPVPCPIITMPLDSPSHNSL